MSKKKKVVKDDWCQFFCALSIVALIFLMVLGVNSIFNYYTEPKINECYKAKFENNYVQIKSIIKKENEKVYEGWQFEVKNKTKKPKFSNKILTSLDIHIMYEEIDCNIYNNEYLAEMMEYLNFQFEVYYRQ